MGVLSQNLIVGLRVFFSFRDYEMLLLSYLIIIVIVLLLYLMVCFRQFCDSAHIVYFLTSLKEVYHKGIGGVLTRLALPIHIEEAMPGVSILQ